MLGGGQLHDRITADQSFSVLLFDWAGFLKMRPMVMRTLLLLFLPLLANAVIVDRVAVSVGTKVITDSEISERIRLTAFENGQTPDFSLMSRRDATKKLIDQKLIDREMEIGHYPHLAAQRGVQLLAGFIEQNYKSDRLTFDAALTRASLTEADLRDDLLREADLLTFLDLRFRPAVEVTEQDIRKYFDEKLSPRTGSQAFNELRAQIEQELTTERSDEQLNIWLDDQRTRTKIDYLEKELAEPALPVPAAATPAK
jgi:hypothetical protein